MLWYTAFGRHCFLVPGQVQPPTTVTGQGEPSLASGPAKHGSRRRRLRTLLLLASHRPSVSPKGGGVDARRP